MASSVASASFRCVLTTTGASTTASTSGGRSAARVVVSLCAALPSSDTYKYVDASRMGCAGVRRRRGELAGGGVRAAEMMGVPLYADDLLEVRTTGSASPLPTLRTYCVVFTRRRHLIGKVVFLFFHVRALGAPTIAVATTRPPHLSPPHL